jgi:spore germination protein GerM
VTPLPAASPTPAEMTVKISLIAIGDNGMSGPKIGCGDSAVQVQVRVPYTQGVLRAALDKLLSIKQRDYGQSGLYNVLYQSDLRLASVAIENGMATIRLAGTLMLGGECDSPRVDAQIRYTALQFSTVQDVAIFLNDKPLADVLSLK